MSDTFDRAQLLAEIGGDEGDRLIAYDDATGKPAVKGTTIQGWISIGRGRNLVGKGITEAESLYLWNNDVDEIAAFADQHWPWWRQMSDARQRALINLGFMGLGALAQFTTFLGLLQAGQFEQAADDLMTTMYAHQLPARARQIAGLIRQG